MKTYQEAEAAVFARGAPGWDEALELHKEVLASERILELLDKSTEKMIPGIPIGSENFDGALGLGVNMLLVGLLIGMEMEKP